MLGDPDQDRDIIAFGGTRRGFPGGRWRLVAAGIAVAAVAVAGLLTCYAVTRLSASPRTISPPATPVKIDGIYLQEQGNGTILLPAALRHAFRTSGG